MREVPGSRLGGDVASASVWPPPPDAERHSPGVMTKVLTVGKGKMTPQLSRQHVLGIAYAEYDREGRVRKHAPLVVQAIDLAPPAWQEVLLQMKLGEVRRAWIAMPDGKTAIMDFEVRSFSVVRPDGTAVPVERS